MHCIQEKARVRAKDLFPGWTLFGFFLLALAIHFLFLLMFHDAVAPTKETVRNKRSLIISDGSELTAPEQDALEYWQKYHNPLLFLTPSENTGFSLVTRMGEKMTPDAIFQPDCHEFPLQDYRGIKVGLERFLPHERFLAGVQTPLFSEIYAFNKKIGVPPVSPKGDPAPVYPLILAENGTSLQINDIDFERFVSSRKHHPAAGTTLSIEPGPAPDLPSHVRILKSCGVPEYDMEALRACARYSARSGMAGPATISIYWREILPSELEAGKEDPT